MAPEAWCDMSRILPACSNKYEEMISVTLVTHAVLFLLHKQFHDKEKLCKLLDALTGMNAFTSKCRKDLTQEKHTIHVTF